MNLAVIPARGGSKRLPRKNILTFKGEPLFYSTFLAAASTNMFDTILLSTEDSEICGLAETRGITVDKRPAALASDSASVVEVCLELLDRLERKGQKFKTLTCLYPTAPLRNANDISSVLQLVLSGTADFCIAATHFDLPAHQALWRDSSGYTNPVLPSLVKERLENVPEIVVDNGSTYSAAVKKFKEEKTFYGSKLASHVMPRSRSVDIDHLDDFQRLLAASDGKVV